MSLLSRRGNCTPWSVALHGAEVARPSQLPVWYSSGIRAGPFLRRVNHSTLEAYVAALPAYRAPLGGLSVGRHPLVTRFLQRLRPPARRLMLCGGSGCYSIASSPLLSPLGDQDSLLRSWPSGRRPLPLSHSVFSRPSCAPFTLGRDLSVWCRGYLVPLASLDAARVPEEERLGLRM